jgi:gas vesicle protein
MGKISIGMVLSQLLKESNLTAVIIAERMGKTKQNVYVDLKRTAMRDEQIADWAKALNIDKQIIYDRWNAADKSESAPESNYLMDHLSNLEEQFKRLLTQLDTKDKQLEVKDRQIEKLMDLLGKPEDVAQFETARIVPLHPEKEVMPLHPNMEAQA